MTFSVDLAMDAYYAQDRLQELWQQIGSLHLSYLEMEESPQKLEQRNKLEDRIRDFLHLAPHNQKFVFRETADVLHRSACTKKDFSGYRAALGFNAIGMYAANLLIQPWRKEYKQILLYSGFYKHQIDANLVGAEVIFEAMGYKHEGDGVLTLDGPICPDRVISLSQDSLIAYVECQILKAIWEEVSTNFKVSWMEVLEFRETYLCSSKQVVQALNYRFHERQFQQHTRSYSQGTDPFSGRYSAGHPTTLPVNHSFPPLHSHASIGSIPVASQCIYGGTNGYYPSNNYGNYNALPHLYHVPFCAQSPKPAYPNYYPNGYSVPPAPPPYGCPTAQLIEVESQNSSHHYDAVDGPAYSKPRQRNPDLYKADIKPSSSEKEETETSENWDYVYRNLESQGYSKDLGERGDVLSPPLESKKTKGVKEAKKTGLEEAMNNLSVSDRAKENQKPKEKRYSEPAKSIKNDTEKKTKLVNGFVKTNNILPPAEKTKVSMKTLELKKSGKQNHTENDKRPVSEPSKNENKWECGTCTFLNDGSREICEMCGKSKVKVQDTMEIGGSQCSWCTLVNPKSNKVCAACDRSLKDSSTYI